MADDPLGEEDERGVCIRGGLFSRSVSHDILSVSRVDWSGSGPKSIGFSQVALGIRAHLAALTIRKD